jgi:hypothetical protein
VEFTTWESDGRMYVNYLHSTLRKRRRVNGPRRFLDRREGP